MTSRDAILAAIRAQRTKSATRPPPYHAAPPSEDAATFFSAQATRAAAEVRRLGSLREVPAAIADALRARNMAPVIHLPETSPLGELIDWSAAPALDCRHTLPGQDDAAVSIAPYAIAETGTLAFASRRDAPASWHFRPGLEIAIVRTANILADFEAVLARAKAEGWPATLNLVTGPSRTGDIEQTIELGAHGPKSLVVLVVEE